MTHEKYTNICNKEWRIQIEEMEDSIAFTKRSQRDRSSSVSVVCFKHQCGNKAQILSFHGCSVKIILKYRALVRSL